MKKGFKIVEVPGQKCRKVAERKQQGHRTANLKRYETPDKNLTVRFFYNISSAFFSSQNKFKSSDYILTKLLGGNDDVSPYPELLSSFNLKLQKAAHINFAGLTHLLVKSNNEHRVTGVKKQILTTKWFQVKAL